MNIKIIMTMLEGVPLWVCKDLATL